MNDDELSIDIANKLNNIDARIAYQRTSYDAIVKLIKNQGDKLSEVFRLYNRSAIKILQE